MENIGSGGGEPGQHHGYCDVTSLPAGGLHTGRLHQVQPGPDQTSPTTANRLARVDSVLRVMQQTIHPKCKLLVCLGFDIAQF